MHKKAEKRTDHETNERKRVLQVRGMITML